MSVPLYTDMPRLDEHMRDWKRWKRREYYKNWRVENKNKVKEYGKKYNEKYRVKNREKQNEYLREYRAKNKDKVREWAKESESKRGGKRKEYNKEWCIKNNEWRKEYHRQHRIKNKDKINERIRKYRIKNRDRLKEREKAYNIKNRDKISKRHKEYRIKNPEVFLRYTIKQLEKNAKPWNKTLYQYKYAQIAWSKAVKKNKPCRICGGIAKDAHHIFERKRFPLMSFILNNGMPLCKRCHDEAHLKNLKGMKPLQPVLDIRQYAWVRAR